MEFDPQDQEVIRQLGKLKQADNEYPPELLAARRRSFVKKLGQVSLGIGAGASAQRAVNGAKAAPTTPVASTVLEAVLVVAIIAEAGAVTYFYRDQLADILRDFVASGEVQEIISPPGVNTPLTTIIDTPSPQNTFTPELESTSTPQLLIVSEAPAVVVVSPTQTPGPGILNATSAANATAAQVNSPPDPNGNNGNHYGQTPKPERTKENNGNNDKPPKDEEKPPKEDKDPPPKEEEKPPKEDKNPPPKDNPKPTKTK